MRIFHTKNVLNIWSYNVHRDEDDTSKETIVILFVCFFFQGVFVFIRGIYAFRPLKRLKF